MKQRILEKKNEDGRLNFLHLALPTTSVSIVDSLRKDELQSLLLSK